MHIKFEIKITPRKNCSNHNSKLTLPKKIEKNNCYTRSILLTMFNTNEFMKIEN